MMHCLISVHNYDPLAPLSHPFHSLYVSPPPFLSLHASLPLTLDFLSPISSTHLPFIIFLLGSFYLLFYLSIYFCYFAFYLFILGSFVCYFYLSIYFSFFLSIYILVFLLRLLLLFLHLLLVVLF